MRTILPFGIFWILFAVAAQVKGQAADTAATRIEVDSLIQLNQLLVKQKKFEEALRIIGQAEEKCKAAFGEESALYATCLSNHGFIYLNSTKYTDAEKFHLRVKEIREKILGKRHPDYAMALNNLGDLYYDMGNYEKSEINYIEAKTVWENTSGKGHLDYAQNLNSIGLLYYTTGDYTKSEIYYLEAKTIFEKDLGKEHFYYGKVINNLANIYADQGDYEKAELYYLEAISISKKAFGNKHLSYARSLNNLASIYRETGKYEKAEPLMIESVLIRRDTLGAEHPVYATGLNNLGVLYNEMGLYEKAEPLYLEAKSIREKALGREHLEYSQSLGNLGSLYMQLGNFEKAEQYYLIECEIIKKLLGKDHQIYAQVLVNLGVLYYDLGNYRKCELLYLEAKDIFERALGREHQSYLSILNNLANLYFAHGDYQKAQVLHLEVKSARERILGAVHPHTIISLENLGSVYSEMGDFDKSEAYYLQAKLILDTLPVVDDDNRAGILFNLGNIYSKAGHYEKAESSYSEAKNIRERKLGREHSDYKSIVYNLGILYNKTGAFKKAEPLFIESSSINRKIIGEGANYLSDYEMSIYIGTYLAQNNNYFSFLTIYNLASPSYKKSAFDNNIFYKGLLLNNSMQIPKMLSVAPDSVLDTYARWKGYHRRLAKQYSLPLTERDSSLIGDLIDKSNTLEKELARTITAFSNVRRQVTSNEMRNNLHKGEAVVEFTHFQYYDQKSRLTDSIFYAALVLFPTDTTPHYIPLFEQKQLSALLSKTQNNTQSVGSLYAAARSGIVLDEFPAYGTELYNLIWKPLDSLLQGVKTVYYSPSGLLHRVNLAAIPVDSTHVLADKYTLRQMSSTRNLVVKTPEPVLSPGYTAALFGGIQYSSDSTALSSATVASRGSETPASRSTLEYTSDVQRDTAKVWTYLEGTRVEVDSLRHQMQRNGLNVKTFTGLAATEESLKALGRPLQGDKSPDILHIATHGFFFDDPEKRREQRFGDENVFRWNENPLFRSGLIMAGADHAWQTGRPYANLEDGICTAYEISHLNLSNTKLAVLSACETGLGDIKGSEGVYGLQRAFKMAGVDYLIVSLWKVPDAQTVEFMDAFYRNWLGGETIHEAFAKAQQMMRQKYGVYEWGAWVLIE